MDAHQAITVTNAFVANAVNPSSFGYHHGPIPNNNHGWVPTKHQNSSGIFLRLTLADVANPPNPPVQLSRVNTGVCDVVVNGGQMCGVTYAYQSGLHGHLRTDHPGAIARPDRGAISRAEKLSGNTAIRLWVLFLGWRNARYSVEPGRGPPAIADICDKAERRAAQDQDFAAQFGTHFHRRVLDTTN